MLPVGQRPKDLVRLVQLAAVVQDPAVGRRRFRVVRIVAEILLGQFQGPFHLPLVVLPAQRQGQVVAGRVVVGRLPKGGREVGFRGLVFLLHQGHDAAQDQGVRRLCIDFQCLFRFGLGLIHLAAVHRPPRHGQAGPQIVGGPGQGNLHPPCGLVMISRAADLLVELAQAGLRHEHVLRVDHVGIPQLFEGAYCVLLPESSAGEPLQGRREGRVLGFLRFSGIFRAALHGLQQRLQMPLRPWPLFAQFRHAGQSAGGRELCSALARLARG